ncbi:hypothetical protein EYF80_011613 [Liparis tanakae]|uniref:Uncharacterized protein n=1 Tax=Liparis tanakae TaxID=230148 RepID=A0A4Z2IJV3_9TELE|nr:hypothetical protein EYF80_011613 [Liparis tanakae]
MQHRDRHCNKAEDGLIHNTTDSPAVMLTRVSEDRQTSKEPMADEAGMKQSEGSMLAQMGGVAQHGRITRLNHRPGRAPWIRGRVEAFCKGASSRGGGRKRGEG